MIAFYLHNVDDEMWLTFSLFPFSLTVERLKMQGPERGSADLFITQSLFIKQSSPEFQCKNYERYNVNFVILVLAWLVVAFLVTGVLQKHAHGLRTAKTKPVYLSQAKRF